MVRVLIWAVAALFFMGEPINFKKVETKIQYTLLEGV